MFKCTIWLDAACLSSTLCESEAISQSLRAISAKHLNITHDVRDAENAGGIAECSHIMEFTV